MKIKAKREKSYYSYKNPENVILIYFYTDFIKQWFYDLILMVTNEEWENQGGE